MKPDWTVPELLLAETPPAILAMLDGDDVYWDRYFALVHAVEAWLAAASEDELGSMLDEARKIYREDPVRASISCAERLTDAAAQRGIPSMTALAAFAEEIGAEDLKEALADLRTIQG